MKHAALLRTALSDRAGIVVTAVASAALLGAASLVLVPNHGEQVQAALRADDGVAARRAAGAIRAGDAGSQVLVARSYLAAGQPARAAAILTPIAARFPDDRVVAGLLDRALDASGDARASLARRWDAARRSDDTATLRDLARLARDAADPAPERYALGRLAAAGGATLDEVERLAAIDEQAGAVQDARTLLAARFAGGATLSTNALHQLLRLSLPTGDAAGLAALVAAMEQRGEGLARRTVVNDLAAAGRPGIALAIADLAPAKDKAALWRTRVELNHALHDDAAARALLAAAIAAPGAASPIDIVQVAYLLDSPEAIVIAAERGAIPRPTPALALDLARRSETKAPGLIARIDRVAGSEWRRADPWLAIRLAERSGDRGAAMRYAALLPGAQADQMREAILVRSGDRAALRGWLLSRVKDAPATRSATAERLLALGWRDDAIALLAQAAATGRPDDAATRRLLYLWGPRPPAAGLAWLKTRAATGDVATRLAWLLLYARRDSPAAALRVLESDPLADRTEMLLARLDLAAAARDRGAGDRALRTLLDGRPLRPTQLAAITAATPRDADAGLRQRLVAARIGAGAELPHDRLDLAWAAWQRGDAAGARGLVADQLATDPRDREALRLMADIEAKAGGERRAAPWLQRALAASPGDTRETAAILARLGRHDDALAMIARLRRDAPTDRMLIADQARMLIAAGKPGRAQALFAQR